MIKAKAKSKAGGKVRRSTVVLRLPTPVYETFFERAALLGESMNRVAAVLINRFNEMQHADAAKVGEECEAVSNMVPGLVVHDRAAA